MAIHWSIDLSSCPCTTSSVSPRCSVPSTKPGCMHVPYQSGSLQSASSTVVQVLEATNYNLEAAINLHFAGGLDAQPAPQPAAPANPYAGVQQFEHLGTTSFRGFVPPTEGLENDTLLDDDITPLGEYTSGNASLGCALVLLTASVV